MARWLAAVRAVVLMTVAMVLLPFYRRIRRGKDPIWLVCERPDEARDNGYHFFRYATQAGVKKDIRYVIARSAVDRRRVETLGPLVTWGSLHHYLTWLAAECLISAHAGNCAPDSWISWRLRKWRMARQRVVNLGHGVTAINLPDFIASGRWDLLVTAAPQEREFLIQDVGHPSASVAVTGLPRYDALHDEMETKNQVLLMPTWRRWLNSPGASAAPQSADAVRSSKWY